MKKLDQIEARCNAATPGPWTVRPQEEEETSTGEVIPYEAAYIPELLKLQIDYNWYAQQDDVEFCAAARTDLPWCLDWMRRAAEVCGDIVADGIYKPGDPVFDLAEQLLKELEQ